MVNSIYCEFSSYQLSEQKRELHVLIHWLLIYKEQNEQQLDSHFETLMCYIGSLNKLLFEPPEILKLLVTLQSAWDMSRKEPCDFQLYKTFIFDAHSLVDKLYKNLVLNSDA